VVQALGVVLIIFIMPHTRSHSSSFRPSRRRSTFTATWATKSIRATGRALAGALDQHLVAHNFHHKTARHNFGFYFLFWDRLMGRSLRV